MAFWAGGAAAGEEVPAAEPQQQRGAMYIAKYEEERRKKREREEARLLATLSETYDRLADPVAFAARQEAARQKLEAIRLEREDEEGMLMMFLTVLRVLEDDEEEVTFH
jgi:hypothetical protein